MARTPAEAIEWGRAQSRRPSQDWHNLCLSFVRQSFGIDYTPVSEWPAADRFAGMAWRRAKVKHPTTDASSIPAGVPVYWDSPSAFEHIALSLGGGRCLSTDVPRGRVGEVGIDELTRAWHMKLLGWSEDLVGNRVRGQGPVEKPGPAPAPAPGGIGLRVDLVDISHHQAGTIDYGAAKRAGVRGMYHKATEGATFTDSRYRGRRNEATAARLPFGAYHFARPAKGDADVEAAHFLKVADPQPGDLLPMLDLEDTGGLNRADLTTWVRTFVANVERAVGVRPIIYTPFDLDDTCGCLLWVARYHPRNEAPRVPAPWKRWDVRQFSNGVFGVPSQVPGFGHVDLNTFRDGLIVAELSIPTKGAAAPAPVDTDVDLDEDVPAVEHPVNIAVVPGRWDAPLPAWLARHLQARTARARFVGLTECTDGAQTAQMLEALALEGWGSYWNPVPGPSQVAHTWDSDRFELVGHPWAVQLDTTPVATKKGRPRPQTFAVGVALRDKLHGGVILFVGAHLELENTVRRRQKKLESIEALQAKGFAPGRAQFPDATRVLWADFNRNAKTAAVRRWWAKTFPGLAPGWVLEQRRAAIDWVAGGTRLVLLTSKVLPRDAADPLDHVTTLTRWAWRRTDGGQK